MGILAKSLTGDYEVLLDDAFRLAIPRSLRTVLDLRTSVDKTKLVLTRGPDPCIRLYAVDDFEERLEELNQIDPDFSEGREILRQNIFHVCEVDKQGRVVIPPELRKYAGLLKDCKVLGLIKYVEIWDAARKAEYECTEEQYKDISERFAISKKKKGLSSGGNSAHAGTVGGNHTVSCAEGQG